MKPDLRCYHHPEREAINQCDCCGDYICSECVKEFRAEYVCRRCLKYRVDKERKRERRKNTSWFTIFMLLFLLLLFVLPALAIAPVIEPSSFEFVD